jgi:hypothetical protein
LNGNDLLHRTIRTIIYPPLFSYDLFAGIILFLVIFFTSGILLSSLAKF